MRAYRAKFGGTIVLALSILCTAGCGKAQDGAPKPPTLAKGTKIALPPPPQKGTTYYVSPQGNNTNTGAKESPWASPGFASRRLKPGDTLVLLTGTYPLSVYDDDILIPPSGAPDNWIVIKGEEGKRPTLAGRDNLAMAMNLSAANCLWVENIEITHDPQAKGDKAQFRDGIVIVEKPCQHIVLKDLHIHHLDEFGLNFQDVSDLKIVQCRIEYCGFGAIGGPAAQQGGWRNVLIRGCRLAYCGHHYQGTDGANRPYDRPDGFGIEPSDGPIEIAETVAEHNRGDGLDSKAANTYIHHCIVANNSCDGVKLWAGGSRVENTLIYGRGDGDKTPTPWSPIVIGTEKAGATFDFDHVTVDDELGGNYILHAQYDTPKVPIRLTVRNTIFRGVGERCPLFTAQATALTAEGNLFFFPKSESVLEQGETSCASDAVGKLGPGNRYGDPLFVSPAWGKEGDYHLKPGSPAVGAGVPSDAPSADLDGKPRAQGKPCAIGAYEP